MTIETEDILKHVGVKGMKWGVRKAANNVKTAVRNRTEKKNQRLKQVADRYHEKNQKSKVYSRQYARNLKAMKTRYEKKGVKSETIHYRAVLKTRKEHMAAKRQLLALAIPLAAPVAAKGIVAGQTAVSRMSYKATSPEAVRAGKNLVNAMQRNPVRYVDGSKLKNVIN